jgi:hypothetical protein
VISMLWRLLVTLLKVKRQRPQERCRRQEQMKSDSMIANPIYKAALQDDGSEIVGGIPPSNSRARLDKVTTSFEVIGRELARRWAKRLESESRA